MLHSPPRTTTNHGITICSQEVRANNSRVSLSSVSLLLSIAQTSPCVSHRMKESVPSADVEPEDAGAAGDSMMGDDADMMGLMGFESVDKLQVGLSHIFSKLHTFVHAKWVTTATCTLDEQDVGVNVSDIKKLRDAGIPTVGLIGKTARKVSKPYTGQKHSRLGTAATKFTESGLVSLFCSQFPQRIMAIKGFRFVTVSKVELLARVCSTLCVCVCVCVCFVPLSSEAKADKIIGLANKLAV